MNLFSDQVIDFNMFSIISTTLPPLTNCISYDFYICILCSYSATAVQERSAYMQEIVLTLPRLVIVPTYQGK